MKVAGSPPTLSIGLPVYNGENYLESTIQAILAQTFSDFELIIVDNASDDGTGLIAAHYAAEDPRVWYFRNDENIGASRNYNRSFELAIGQYFKWSAHDDYCYPEMFARCIEVLETGGESTVMAYPLGELIDAKGATVQRPLDHISDPRAHPHQRLASVLSGLNMCDPIFGVYRSDALRKTRLIGSYCGPDYVLLGHLAEMGMIFEVEEVLFGLRKHAGRSMTANKSLRERMRWYDPQAASRALLLPVWEQMVWALLKTTWYADLGPFDKAMCLVTVPAVHYHRRLRAFGGRVKRRLLRHRSSQVTN